MIGAVYSVQDSGNKTLRRREALQKIARDSPIRRLFQSESRQSSLNSLVDQIFSQEEFSTPGDKVNFRYQQELLNQLADYINNSTSVQVSFPFSDIGLNKEVYEMFFCFFKKPYDLKKLLVYSTLYLAESVYSGIVKESSHVKLGDKYDYIEKSLIILNGNA